MPLTLYRDSSPKNARKETKQDRLNRLSSSIDLNNLSQTEPLSFDKKDVVVIDSSHPDYHYWVKDQD